MLGHAGCVEYPCIPADDGSGYTCRGQYAAWPMPDSDPQAKFAPDYTVDAEAGTVLDEVTGLLWQRDLPRVYPGCTGRDTPTPGATCTWSEAKRYCEQLQLAERRWRLPSAIELMSLVDFARHSEVIAVLLDSEAFSPPDQRTSFWSITTPLTVFDVALSAGSRVEFSLGVQTSSVKTMANAVRCVRSERVRHAPPERFHVLEGGDAALDMATRLEWQLGPSAAVASFEGAVAYCTSIERRVPTIKELHTLVDLAQRGSPIDPLFSEPSHDSALFSTSIGRFEQRQFFSPSIGTSGLESAVNDPVNEWETRVRCVR